MNKNKELYIFLSLPMRGLSEEEIKEKISKYQHEVLQTMPICELREVHFIDSLIDEEHTPIGYLAESIKMIDKSDMVVFCPDWQYTRGCLIENMVATSYGKQVVYL